MKKLYYLIFLAFCASNLNSQNIRFSYQVTNTVAGQSKLIVYAQTTSGTENVATFNFGFYYKSSEATVQGYAANATDTQMAGSELNAFDGSYATSLGWNVDLNGSIEAIATPPPG